MAPELAVIFDLDGLLADTEPLWTASAERLLRRRGRAFDPSLKASLMGRAPLEVMARIAARYDLTEAPAALLAERLEILQELYSAGISPMDGAAALVAELRRDRIPLAVASGSPASLIPVVLREIGLADALPTYVSSDQVERGKPAPDLFLLALL